jgi:hypothetical protein
MIHKEQFVKYGWDYIKKILLSNIMGKRHIQAIFKLIVENHFHDMHFLFHLYHIELLDYLELIFLLFKY